MHLDDWTRIKSGYTDNLILGNGASIAIKPALSYRSLHDDLKTRGKLSPELLRLFEAYETSNFEFILRLLLESNQVNKYLGIEDTKTKKYYTQLRNALISTILELHPKYEIVQHFLPKMFLFLKRYETVLSLNYDTLVYWAMLYGNEKLGYTHFKDCFVRGTFENDFKYLYTPAGSADDVTLVFYPHGSLFLASNICGDETKL